MENFFHDEIERAVFISEEQLEDMSIDRLYGRYWEDTYIYSVYPEEIRDRAAAASRTIIMGSRN